MKTTALGLAAALCLVSGSASANGGSAKLEDYTAKNRAYFAKLDREHAAGKYMGPHFVTEADRRANAAAANPPGWNLALELARPWVMGSLMWSATVNPIGTQQAMQTFLNMNAFRMPF
jgi:hypothetical protein